ncbi:MAG: hypothetical protein V4441_13625 [Pseudomonadota bacterium]
MSLLVVLSLYMYVLFRRERREAMAYLATGGDTQGHAAAPAADHGHGQATDHGHASDHGHVSHAPAATAHHAPMVAAPVKKKRRFVWRLAPLWVPIVLGFAAQAYLDFGGHTYYQETIKPILEKSTAS